MGKQPAAGRQAPELHYWSVLQRYRLVIAACFALGVIIAVAIGQLLTPIYRSTAVLMIGGGSAHMTGMDAVTMESYYERRKDYLTQPMLITSRAVLLQAVESLRAQGCDEFAGLSDKAAASVLRSRITASPRGDSRLIDVSYEGPNVENVAIVTNGVVRCFKQQSRKRSVESSGSAKSWLEDRQDTLFQKLVKAEDRVYEFRKANSLVSLDNRYDTVSQRLAQLNQDVTKVERQRIALEAAVALVERVGADPSAADSLPIVMDNPTLRGLRAQIVDIEGRKTELLLKVKHDHPEVHALDERVVQLREQLRKETTRLIAADKNRLEMIRADETALRKVLEKQQAQALALSDKMVELAARERAVERIKQPYESLLERSQKVSLASGLESVPVANIDLAEKPSGPSKPRKTLIALAGAVLGLLAGLRLAFTLNKMDAKVRSSEDIEAHAGLEAVNVSPHLDGQALSARSTVCAAAPKSPVAEAFRSLRTKMLQSGDASSGETILVTSAAQGEGKTHVVTNLASAFSQLGEKVLVIDADMRRSRIHKNLDLDGARGLSSVLGDGAAPGDVVVESSVPNLFVMPAGEPPHSPAELLSLTSLDEVLDWARGEYGHVIIDSPPLLAVTDATLLAKLADRVLLVARSGVTQTGALSRARHVLDDLGARVVGAVLNDARATRDRYGYGCGYGYGYGYGYGHDSSD